MKKILLLFALVIASLSACAGDKYSHDASVLPTAAKTVLQKNFKARVNLVKIDKELGRVSEYEVILTDGSEITFDRNGNWKEVEVGRNKSVPSGFVLQPIQNYVKTNQKGARIVGIDKNRNGYEVELSNGVDIKFDNSGNFVRYDD
ncbi:MAG: PepSY-like domain-containing protein [Muribaculum sp.]|nr:PepSY-like domain-containing protein [Muribaculum sp.]